MRMKTSPSLIYLIIILAATAKGVKKSSEQFEDEKMRRFLIGPILAAKFSKINDWVDKFFPESGLLTTSATDKNQTGLEVRLENFDQKIKNVEQQMSEMNEKISYVAKNISGFEEKFSGVVATKFSKIKEWLDQFITNQTTMTTTTPGNITVGESLYEKIDTSKDAWEDTANLLSTKTTSLEQCAILCSKTENCHSFQYMEESFADNCRLGTCHRKMFEHQQGSSETVEVYVSDHISQQYNLSGAPWRLVRHVPAGDRWHPATDDLKGTDVYGDPKNMQEPFSIKFYQDDFNQFLFEDEDLKYWLIVNKKELLGENGEKFYSNAKIPVIASSQSCVPYAPKMYNRNIAEDPWVSIEDHPKQIVYGEAKHVKHDGFYGFGFNVFIRKV